MIDASELAALGQRLGTGEYSARDITRAAVLLRMLSAPPVGFVAGGIARGEAAMEFMRHSIPVQIAEGDETLEQYVDRLFKDAEALGLELLCDVLDDIAKGEAEMANDDESYADAPESLGHHRAHKTWNAKDWTPRDALVDALRRIDRGELKLDTVVVCMREKIKGGCRTSYSQAGGDAHISLGLMEQVKHKIMHG